MVKEGFYEDDFTGMISLIKNGKVYDIYNPDCQECMTPEGIAAKFDIFDVNAPENQEWLDAGNYIFYDKVTIKFPWATDEITLTPDDIDTSKAVSHEKLYEISDCYEW